MAAGGLTGGAWHGLERASAKPKSGGEGPRDAWATEHDELMAGKAGKPLHGAGVGAVGGRRRGTEQGGGGGRQG